MKKLLSLLLTAILFAGAALPPAAAAGNSDAELERITQSVKSTLGLDTERYSSFQGNYEEGELVPSWNLYWDGDAGSLSVSALTDGTIVSYSLSSPEAVSSGGSGLPSFPKGDPEQARTAAERFLQGVLGDGESVALDEPDGPDRLDSTTYRFSGTILLNGLPSPLSCSVTVQASDNTVTRFRRDVPGNTFLGDVPGPDAKVTQDTARQALRSKLSLRLEYIRPDKDSTTAVLCYLPDPVDTYYVDAATGALVNLTALEEEMYKQGMGGASSDAGSTSETAQDNGLSAAEQAGIQQLEGVLSSTELDKAVRGVPEYGLDAYTLTSAFFSVGESDENGEIPVTCLLRYNRTDGEKVWTRTFTMDARTGQVQRLDSGIPWEEEDQPSLTEEEAKTKAEAFLKNHYEEAFAHLALYQTPGNAAVPLDSRESVPAYTFQYARQENGYFFPEQYYSVRIDATDGSVCGFSFQYDEMVTFDDPQGVLSAQSAMDAWMDTYQVTLGYLLVPQKLSGSDSVSRRLVQMGLTSYYYLKLGYSLEREETCRGIDAKSGEPVAYAWQSQETGLTYDDAAGSWAQREIQRLARYDVGYEGGTFQPNKALTQWDLVCLLYSLNFYPLDPAKATDDERNQAYLAAYSMGVLTRADRKDQAALTRSQLVKYLLDGAGYGSVARLEGIFTCAYPDRDAIPAEGLGYAALAQGLGLVQGAYRGTDTATRAQAAAMLCRLMER